MLNKLFGFIGWLGTLLVLAAVVVRFTMPGREQVWYGLVIAGLVCAVLYMTSQWREFAGMFAGRQARYGTLASASVVIVLGLLIGVNYIGTRQNKRWDLTSSGEFTLSPQTVKVLQSLDKPVKALVFEKETDFDRFRSRFNEYEYYSKQFSAEYIDPDKTPTRARQYQVTAYGTIILEYEGRTERVSSEREQDLTNALIKVVEGRSKKVYFIQGHGEKDTVSGERNGYNAIAQALNTQNFVAEKLVLAQQTSVPEDATLIVFAGPKGDLLAPEVSAVGTYLKKGGKVLFMLDPPEETGQARMPNLLAFLKEWDIEVGDNVVVDASGMGQLIGTDASIPVAASYPTHPITDNFNVLTAFPLARAVSPISGGAGGRYAQTFVETSPQSWAEVDITGLMKTGKVAMSEADGDKRGPISIGATVSVPADAAAGEKKGDGAESKDETPEAPKPESRLVVIGDSDFATNSFLGVQGNRDLFVNTVNWLAQQENLIAIAPRNPEDRRLTLTSDQQNRIFLLSVFLIPGLVLGTGIYTWWRRR